MGGFTTSLFIARRYFGSARRGAVSFFALAAVSGIALGVAALLIVIGVMSGFQRELKSRILGMNPHVVINHAFSQPITDPAPLLEEALSEKGVTQAAPYVFTKAVVKSKEGSDGVAVKGIDGVFGPEVQSVTVHGEGALGERRAVVGEGVAARMGLFVGDTIWLYSSLESINTPIGPAFRYRPFVVGGIFDAGLYDYNENLIFISLGDARELFMDGAVSGVELRLEEPFHAEQIAARLSDKLGPAYRATAWTQMNRSLFSALKIEKLAMFIILVLIVLVAAFNIITTLTMLSVEKTWEIGVLRALGMTRGAVMRVFILVGTMMGCVGTLVGAGVGLLVSLLVGRLGLIKLPPDVYFIDTLPMTLAVTDVAWVLALALAISFLAAAVPARRAASLPPVSAIGRGQG